MLKESARIKIGVQYQNAPFDQRERCVLICRLCHAADAEGRLFSFRHEHQTEADGKQCAADPDGFAAHHRRQDAAETRAYAKDQNHAEISQSL